jgi:hypothetical protein
MEIALTSREVENAIVEYLERHANIKVDNIELQGYDPYQHIVIIASLNEEEPESIDSYFKKAY